MSISAITTRDVLHHVQNQSLSQESHIHRITKACRANIFVKIAFIAATAFGMIALAYFYPPSLSLTIPSFVYLGEKAFSIWKEASEFKKMQEVFGGEEAYNQIPTINLDDLSTFNLVPPTRINGRYLRIAKGIKYGRPALILCMRRNDRTASLCLAQVTSSWEVIHASNCNLPFRNRQKINSNDRETLRAWIEGSR